MSAAVARLRTKPAGTTAPWWWQRFVTVAVGVPVAAAVAVSWAMALGPSGSPARVLGAALGLVGVALLPCRRRLPYAVVAVEVALASATVLLMTTAERNGAMFLVALALYVLATVRPPVATVIAAFASALCVTAATLLHAASVGQLTRLVPDMAFLTAAVAIGFAVRAQRSLLATFRERAEQAEREQRWTATRAVAAERARIARELHDIVAHHVSLLVVQAGAVRETLPADHVTRPVLDSMIDGGRRAMSELRDMLGALRLDEAADEDARRDSPGHAAGPPLAPLPTIEMVPDLVSGAAAAGLPVTLQVEGAPVETSAAVSLSAYRIVQEALTNAIRHAPGAFTSVLLSYSTGVLDVAVRNGPAPRRAAAFEREPTPGAPSGHGLTGMRERAAQGGGILKAGPVKGGWEVRASFPLVSGTAGAALPAGQQ
ncbi:MAG: histidine kinase [Actinomycetota bacterium]|nr:histidine kinase [Actinomycetota bacterium]